MRTVELTDAGATPLSDAVREALTEPVVVTLNGRPVAAVTAIGSQTDLENVIVSSDPSFRALIEQSRALHPPGSGLTTAEVRRRLQLPKAQRRTRAGSVPTRRQPASRGVRSRRPRGRKQDKT